VASEYDYDGSEFDGAETVTNHQAARIRKAEGRKWEKRVASARNEGYQAGWNAALAEARE
jgi:hypothetical protein